MTRLLFHQRQFTGGANPPVFFALNSTTEDDFFAEVTRRVKTQIDLPQICIAVTGRNGYAARCGTVAAATRGGIDLRITFISFQS